MGLDCYIHKEPENEQTEVKYWRKNWVLQNWIESANCENKEIDIEYMQELLNYILDTDNHHDEGSEGWKDDDWDAFADDIREVIIDMKENITYKYTYHGWW